MKGSGARGRGPGEDGEATRNAILNVLRENERAYVSGEDISRMLDVSRTAVWKHMQGLRRDGYTIESNPRQGYKLVAIPDLLLPNEVLNGLQTRRLGRTIYHYPTIGSTNQEAKRLAADGAPEGTLIIAEQQTCGRGRMSRPWFSPGTGGIWFSLILRPGCPPAEAAKFTFMGAVAVAYAVRAVTGLAVEIKWPNDIHFQGRKLAGILTELNAEMDAINFIVMGIGINVNIDINAFPADLQETATSLQREISQTVSRHSLLRNILQQFEVLYEGVKADGFSSIFAAWRNMNCTLGYEVSVSSFNRQFTGVAVDIDDEGALIVERQDGKRDRVVAGDVSVRRRISGD